MNKYSILLVEDDQNLGSVLQEYLELKNYDIRRFTDGESAWAGFHNGQFDLCIFDVMMPKKDGFTLARQVREVNSEIPIIFLTAKSMKQDRIEGFSIGADDYITKPFSIEELLMRVQAVLRRCSQSKQNDESDDNRFVLGEFIFDYQNLMLQGNKSHQQLTQKEADLLRSLCRHKNEILRREIVLKEIWGNDSYFNGRSMDVFIAKLRKYLKDDSSVEIVNIHGTGYKLSIVK